MRFFNRKFLIIFVFVLMFFSMNTAFCASTKQQIKKVEQKRTVLQKKIKSLAKLEKKQTSIITKNQQKLEKNRTELKNSRRQLYAKQNNIQRLQKDLNRYAAQYQTRNAALSGRIRCIYKTKHSVIFDLLIASDSISQFLDRIYYQNLIIKSDRQKMDVLKSEAGKLTSLKREVEHEKQQIVKIIKNIDKENSSIQKSINQNKAILQKIQKDKRAYEKSERELARQSGYLAKMIYETTKDSSVAVQGKFILPVNGARISSPFGYRIHPIFKSKIFHSGIDYAIAYGTPIKASNSGKVIYSGWYGGYGKVVIIDHGSCTGAPTTTLYAHMSRQNVSAGQFVNRGDIIGFVGSTGYSTGPHVHFEVRINGKPQNPKNFL